tara:strand:- start:178 stop:339 length:162 start_codon:yes stop_codon:yes gene_type:complete
MSEDDMPKTELDRIFEKHTEELCAIIRESTRWQILGFSIIFGAGMAILVVMSR